jgi:enoyl-CoA hydratase
MSDDVLLCETANGVRTLTLNRPQARNALSAELRQRLFSALGDAEIDDDVDVVILTGADPAFCAGLDLKELSRGAGLPDLSWAWPALTKPVIGAINGVAITGGFEIALHCDVLIASERARFADTHARVGLLPRWGLSVYLPLAVGPGLARRLSLTGDFLSADAALRAGLVTEVVPHGDLLPSARGIAATIVGNNRAAVSSLLASYHRIGDHLLHDALALEVEAADAWRRTAVDAASIAAGSRAAIDRGRTQNRASQGLPPIG